MKRPADCAGGSASFINKTSYRSRFKPLQHVDSDVPRAWGTHESAGAPVCFSRLRASLRIPGRSGAQQRRKEASKLSLDFSCQWLRRGGLLRFAPSLLSNAETDDPEEVEGGGGEESISGCVCPRLDLRKGGALRDDRERRQHLLSGGAALRHSSAEQRGEELCGRDG